VGSSSWLLAAHLPRLGVGEVHVWRCRIDAAAPAAERLIAHLDGEERARLARFVHAEGRRRFVVARGVLRELAGGYLDLAAGSLRFAVGEHGKPVLAAPSGVPPLRFNLSHAGELVVLAFASGGEVGVDVERIRANARWKAVAARSFAPAEAAALDALPARRRRAAFFLAWSCKEAVLKARGEGLVRGLAAPLVPLPLGDAAVWVAPSGGAGGERWRLLRLRPGRGYVGALACAPRCARVRCFTWSPALR
jgi:4'-phosphopantetheinyl transferase